MQLAVIVPFRDRHSHLERFVPYMKEYLKGIPNEIVVIEQTSDKLFNRGKLMNVGFALTQAHYYAFHDVDQLPHDVDYRYPDTPVHLACRMEHNHKQLPFKETMGGVALLNREDVLKINGFDNDYWGWGWEDVDLYMRCTMNGLEVKRYDEGWYESLPHDRSHIFQENKEYHRWCEKNSARFHALMSANGFEYSGPFIHNDSMSEAYPSGISDLEFTLLGAEERQDYTLYTVSI